jgi:heme exporter protein B
VMFDLSGPAMLALMLSLAIGTPAMSAAGAIGASLTLSLRRGGLILPLIMLPLLVPAVIFGPGMVTEVQTGLASGAFPFLAAFSLATVLLSPFVAAMAVRLNLAG